MTARAFLDSAPHPPSSERADSLVSARPTIGVWIWLVPSFRVFPRASRRISQQVFVHVPVAAEHLHGRVRGAHRRLARDHGSRRPRAVYGLPASASAGPARSAGARHPSRRACPRAAAARAGRRRSAAERRALPGVRDGGVEAALRDADAPGREQMRPLSSADIATLKPSPSSPSRADRRAAHIVERGCRVSCCTPTELALQRPRLEAPRTPVGTRNAVIPRGPSPPVRANTIAVSAHEPSVMKTSRRSISSRRRSFDARVVERRCIGAAAGLSERVTAEPLAACKSRRRLVLLLLGPPLRHRLPVQAVRDRDDAAHRREALPSSSQSRRSETESSPPPPSSSGSSGRQEARLGERGRRANAAAIPPRPRARVRDELARAELRASSRSAPARVLRVKSKRTTSGPSPPTGSLQMPVGGLPAPPTVERAADRAFPTRRGCTGCRC